MGADQNIDWTRAAASALDWWREAGVDAIVEDAAFDWLGTVPLALTAPVPVEPAAFPLSFEDFGAWRLSDTAPEAIWGTPRIAASGPVEADLMVVVDCPERDDREQLLGGAAGRLFERMLAAIGRTRVQVHLASICVARPVAGRMPRTVEARLAEIARHHVALVSPPRLLVLGDAASRALLPTDVAETRGRLRTLNHKDGKTTRAVASFHPRFLLEKPACKAEAWKDLQMLMRETA